MREHYHVRYESDEMENFVTTDLYAAIDAAADELRDLADSEYQAITALGDGMDYQGAYRAFKKFTALDHLMRSARNVVKQHNLDKPDRAPLYQTPGANATDYHESDKLYQTAQWVIGLINRGSSLDVYRCTSIDIIADNEGHWYESVSLSGQ